MNPETLPLRDIHLPDPIAWWPPALGWWLLLLGIVVVCAIVVWGYRVYQRRRLQRIAKQVLQAINEQYAQHKDPKQFIQAVSIWLRRVCISRYPRAEVAGLTGDAWLAFLDQVLADSSQQETFSNGVGRALLSAPYQAQPHVDADALLQLCQHWISQLPPRDLRA